MLKRKLKELTTADAPDNIEPWEMLDEAGIAAHTARVREAFPLEHFIPIARRLDKPLVACFDKGADGSGKGIVVIEDNARITRRYPGFVKWFDAALADAAEE